MGLSTAMGVLFAATLSTGGDTQHVHPLQRLEPPSAEWRLSLIAPRPGIRIPQPTSGRGLQTQFDLGLAEGVAYVCANVSTNRSAWQLGLMGSSRIAVLRLKF